MTITVILDKKIEKKQWTKTRAYTLISFAVLLILVSYRFAFISNKSTLNVDTERISIGSVRKGDFQEYVPVDGIVAPGETIYLDIIQGGMVEKVYVEDGTEVRKGDTLAKLSNTNLELEYINRETQMFDIMNNLQNSKATLDKNRIELRKQLMEVNYKIEVLKRKYDVNKELVKGGAISENEYAESKREYDYLTNQKKLTISAYALDSIFISTQMQTLNSSIQRMRNNLNTIHKILDQLFIAAPVSGQLSSLNATVGELKRPGDKMGQIDVQDYYKIRVNIDERYVAKVYAGQEAQVEYMGKYYELKVSRILPEVKDGTFLVNLLFGSSVPQGIKRGQNLPVKIKFGGISKALMIPRGAFYQSSGGNWIYVLDDKQQKAVKRNIKIGRQNAVAYEVLEGLDEGEKVIVSTYKSFNDKDELILNTKN